LFGLGDGDEGERAWGAEDEAKKRRDREPGECIIAIREYDIAYYLRVAIDLGESHFSMVLYTFLTTSRC
jgi:DNA polymerase epsilon subunit 1